MDSYTNEDPANDEVELRLSRKKSNYVIRRAAEYNVSIVKTAPVKFFGLTLGNYVTLKGEDRKINALVLNAHYI